MSRSIRALALAAFSLTLTASAFAETIVRNDSIPPAGVAAVGVQTGTRFAARLTSPMDGTIVGVQIVWGSESGLAAPSQETAIRISAFDVNPLAPASTLATIVAPVLIDGLVNEYRFLDPGTNLLPLAVPITAGTSFFVDLQIANSELDSPDTPGILMDADGFESLRNSFSPPGNPNWLEFPLGVSGGGDFGIRAIIQPVPEPSTCALTAIGVLGLLAFRRRAKRGQR